MAVTLTQERLKELLHYDVETGIFTWAVKRCNVQKGDVAGTPRNASYVQIRVDGSAYLAHRLAWLYVHGVWPKNEIDHINGIRSDNKIKNIREATRVQNGQNERKARRGARSGYLGAAWSERSKKWIARISVDGKQIYLGRFQDPGSAHAAYVSAKRKFHSYGTI
jgi:hypothetical protein